MGEEAIATLMRGVRGLMGTLERVYPEDLRESDLEELRELVHRVNAIMGKRVLLIEALDALEAGEKYQKVPLFEREVPNSRTQPRQLTVSQP